MLYEMRVGPPLKPLFILAVVLSAISAIVLLAIPPSRHEFTPNTLWNNYNESSSSKYSIDTIGCKILRVDPFNKEVTDILSPNAINCTGRPPLVSMDGNVIKVNKKVLHHHAGITSHSDPFECCYEEIVRVTQDIGDYDEDADRRYMTIGDCIPFTRAELVHNYVRVRCQIDEQEIYRNFYAYPQISRSISEKTSRLLDTYRDKRRPLSVLVVGIDSVSNAHAKRTIPEAIDFLMEKGAVELKGYTRVGENTLPNFSALFAGQTEAQLIESCIPEDTMVYDNCPFIWKDFDQKGYVTAYGEEFGSLSTFRYLKTGFVKQPVDYYLVTMLQATQRELPLKRLHHAAACHGDRLAVDIVNQYTIDFAYKFKNSPYFALFWTNTLSHEDSSATYLAGQPYFRLFKELFNTSSVDDTVIIFISDHGIRHGQIRKTMQGWMEESLPFAYIWFPPWFRTTYPDLIANLVRNSDMLTTPYDIHETLQMILNDNVDTQSYSHFGVNLLRSIPDTRTCEDAGVPDTLCRCRSFVEISLHTPEVQSAARYSLAHINDYLSQFDGCVSLSIKSVDSASWFAGQEFNSAIYLVTFRVSPSDALFQAQCIHFTETNEFKLSGEVSRINSYRNQSYCVNDKRAKKFCFCSSFFE